MTVGTDDTVTISKARLEALERVAAAAIAQRVMEPGSLRPSLTKALDAIPEKLIELEGLDAYVCQSGRDAWLPYWTCRREVKIRGPISPTRQAAIAAGNQMLRDLFAALKKAGVSDGSN